MLNNQVQVFRAEFGITCHFSERYRYASLNDGDTFWEMRR